MAVEIIEVECPGCGEMIQVRQEEFVDVKENPEYREKIIEGDFFLNRCPSCGDVVMVEYPLMYMDPDRKLNFYMAPEHEDGLLEQLNSLELPESAVDAEAVFRLVPNGLGLTEKILIAETGRDDRVLELCKFVIWDQVREEWPDLEPGDLLYMFDEDGEYFVIWPSDNGQDEKLTVPLDAELYREIEEHYMDALAIPAGKYAEVDQRWIGERFER